MTSIKYVSHQIVIIVFFIISLLFLNTCREDSPTEPEKSQILSDNITVDPETHVLTQEISSSGGSIIISKSDSELNGMEIIVPEKGYNESRTYIISSSPIKEHTLGEYVNPVSPLITIKNGGGYSEMPIRIKVPIQKEPDEFLIGFMFNEVTGELEALPIVELEDSYIIVETRHFALSSIMSELSLGKTSNDEAVGNLIISSIKESILSGQTVISSGFTPGIDDWEFPNWGSYIASGGHCAGQSVTAMWYFYEKKLMGAPSLYHQFDSFCNSEKPNFIWQDNPFGYRLASTVQEDAVWGRLFEYQSKIPDYLVWKCFIYEMLRTGNPQFVGIINTVPGVGGGHALIAYKVNVTEGKIYVADPNYPNNRSINGINSERMINYSNNMFQPYPSYANVGDPGKEYDQIRYYSTSTIFDWSKIGDRFKEFEEKTIGNDRFPQYDLYYKKGVDDHLFSDGLTVDEDTLKLFCKNENIPGFIPGTDRLQHFWIFDSNGNFITSENSDGIGKVLLSPGANRFGISILGYINAQKPKKFVDFKWVNVNLNKEPTPNYNHVGLVVYCGTRYVYTTPDTSYERVNEKVSNGTWQSYPGSFSGNTFNANYYKSWDSQTNPLTITGTITATFNNDYTTITTITWNETHTTNEASSSEDLTATNIPLDELEWGTVYQVKGEETCNHITTLTDVQNAPDGLSWALPEYWCNGDSKIYISFSKE